MLWSETAHRLLQDDTQVTVNYRWWENESGNLARLRVAGAKVWTRQNQRSGFWPLMSSPFRSRAKDARHAKRWLAKEQPDFVLVTLGYHLDAVAPAGELIRRKIPYAINVQCASPDYVDDIFLDGWRAAYANAKKVYFVSQENLERVETNLAMKLATAQIVDNPFNVSFDANPDWPNDDGMFRLACVGRLHFPSKSQDLLIDVLKQRKWRDRNLCIRLFGESQGNRRQLEDLIALHGLRSTIQFAGYCERVEDIWANHHGLILPSRYEGAALAVVEALLCNRICITTDVGRNRELIEDGATGYISLAPTTELLDATLEAAWQNREQWKSMGELAGQRIRQHYRRDPVSDFLADMSSLISDPS